MFGHTFYRQTMRKYVAAFGTLFNDITISRKDNSGTTIQEMKVPIHYGPYQKFLAKLEQDPNLTAPAMTLPRMSFEIVGFTYDSTRKLSSRQKVCAIDTEDSGRKKTQFVGIPYNIEFQLSIMVKYDEDGMKIVEQILPFFAPDFTPTMNLLDDVNMLIDTPVVLTGISKEDTYEADFETRRALIWTLTFTLKGMFFGPTSDQKVIKFVETSVSSDLNADPFVRTIIRPGLTANGEPTTDASNSVSVDDIFADDDWGYIVTIEDL